MANTLPYKIIQGGLFPPVPSLPQSRTVLIRGISGQSNNSDLESVMSVVTVSRDTSINTDDGNESDTSTSSSSSSDWDARTVISTVSTVLPQRQKTHQTIDITPYLSQQFLIEFKKDHQIDITYDVYQLFYPYTNLQSLLFSQIQPFIESDYKKSKAFGATNDKIEYDENEKHNVKMNWNDISSVNRIKGLINKLISSSSSNQGIKEHELYLMFSSPSPAEIIEQLRFGALSVLCDVHIDRFGRRSYHRQSTVHGHGHEQKRTPSQLHFYNHSKCPSSMFAAGDIIGLSDFIQEDVRSEISRHDNLINIRSSIAKIHYHDNDVVMVTSTKNGKTETEVKWQNFAIHSYLYRKTRLSQRKLSDSISNTFKKKRNGLKNQMKSIPFNRVNTRARAIGQYGQSVLPYMFKTHKSQAMDVLNIDTSKERGMRTDQITKEGFLEKENNGTSRSLTNIISKQWVPYWCVLCCRKLLLYKNNRNVKNKKGKNLKKAIECIDLDKIAIPISASYDILSKYFTFRLVTVDGDQFYVFRTRSEYERNYWLSKIDSMLDYEHNVGQKQGSSTKSAVQMTKLNEKPANCLIM